VGAERTSASVLNEVEILSRSDLNAIALSSTSFLTEAKYEEYPSQTQVTGS